MIALPHFSFKNLDAFVQASPDFGKTQSRQKSFVAHTRRPEPVLSTALKCSARDGQRAASMPHSRIKNYFNQ